MIRRIVAILVPVAALLGGAAAGDALRGKSALGDPATAAHAEGSATDAQAPPGDHASATATGPAEGTQDEDHAEARVSFKFPQQFFVPLVRGGEVRGVMVLSLSLDMAPGTEEAVYARENQLRDALLRRLMMHANSGGFDGNFTAEAHQTLLRRELIEAAKPISPGVERILIGDIALQSG